MKKHVLFILSIVLSINTFGHHIVGGDMRYEFVGKTANTTIYKITLRLFRDNNCAGGCPVLPSKVSIGVFDNDNNKEYPSDTDSTLVDRASLSFVPVNAFPPCIVSPPDINYSEADYTYNLEVPDNLNGYTVAYQTCCRIDPLENAQNPDANGFGAPGSTYSCYIPGSGFLNVQKNSSPVFNTTLSVICQNKPFTFDFSATDPDSDSLVYSFAPAFDKGNARDSSYVNPSAPPYQSIQYINGYTYDNPIGLLATINPKTGIISGTAPNSGRYVVCVTASEYRNGKFIGYGRKDFIINVASCDFSGAKLDPRPVTCDGFSVNFYNANNSPQNKTFYWDFGEPASGTKDTSTLATPVHQYTTAGDYVFKLVVNRGQDCSDSATQTVKVYPGFSPGFTISTHCKNIPIQFSDTTKTAYGSVNSWHWDFGDGTNQADTLSQNPKHTYTSSGSFNVKLRVTNTKGCDSTVIVSVTIINNPNVTVSPSDTSYCGKDSVTLSASADVAATFSWSPFTNIINPNSANPTVFPTVTTQYVVTADAGGCYGKNTVTVRPTLDFGTSISSMSKSICEEDTLMLTATSNHSSVKYLWSPNYNIQNPDSSIAKVFPKVDTTYFVQGKWGNGCTASDSIRIRVKPLAKPVAGPSQGFCDGSTGVQLNASGGDDYVWSPSSGLSNSNIPNPIARPSATTTYVVAVGVTGCAKKRYDSLVVTVRPHPSFTKTNDTLICSIDTLQLNAFSPSGGTFSWTPNYNIINPNSANPQVFPKTTTRYYVTLTDPYTCTNTDSVLVNVKDVVTTKLNSDTTICLGDTITLNPISDALHYKWSPSSSLNNDTAKYPKANPSLNTLYHLISNIGKCQSNDSIMVKVVPYPIAKTGNDTTICFGDTIQLHASGGSTYLWKPSFFLNDPHIADPIATPQQNIRYVVQVNDNLGCPKPGYDTIFIHVNPKINADAGPSDTSIVANQPLQLNGSGGDNYLWTPATGLNNPTISNPIAILSNSITYKLRVGSNQSGCFAYDTIRVLVYTVLPGLYIPNAFTPNGNGRNDIFRPIAIGIKKLNYFKIFNRWGQLIYATTTLNAGWDGNFNGKPQDANVYVWIAEAVDFNNKIITKKGTVTLIR